MLGSVQGSFPRIFSLNPQNDPMNRNHHPHFTDKRLKAHKGKGLSKIRELVNKSKHEPRFLGSRAYILTSIPHSLKLFELLKLKWIKVKLINIMKKRDKQALCASWWRHKHHLWSEHVTKKFLSESDPVSRSPYVKPPIYRQ